jgi:molybdopterin-guanine dinucleotide biosynthesis protein A
VIARHDITGLVLAGGRGTRMGGADKGLQRHRGQPLAASALARLAPQVGTLLVSANRQWDDYAALGVPVVADSVPDQPGPLAGLLAGLEHMQTEWLAAVPCDVPEFPLDLVERLAAAVGTVQLAVAFAQRRHPVFCLLHRSLRAALARDLAAGQRRVNDWTMAQGAVQVRFDDEAAFANLNTLAQLTP